MDWNVYSNTPISRLPKALRYPALVLRNIVQLIQRLRDSAPQRPQLPLACRLGNNRLAQVRILALYLIFKARVRLGLGRSRPRRVRLRLGDRVIDWWVADRSDFDLLALIFVAGEYDGPLPHRADLIVDLGAHIGTSVVFWRQRYPEAEIVAVEPDPESFRRLSRHLAGDPGVRLIPAAVTPTSGKVRFAPSELGWTSRLAHENDPAVEVDGLSFPDLLERVGRGRTIDLLKVDIEGGEYSVLDSPLSSVSTMVIETHAPSGEPTGDDASLGAVAAREGMRLVRTETESMNWLVRDR